MLTGNGQPFVEKEEPDNISENELKKLSEIYNMSTYEEIMIKNYFNLDRKRRDFFIKTLFDILPKISNFIPEFNAGEESIKKEAEDTEIAEELALYRKEIEAKKKRKIYSVLENIEGK